MNLTREGNFNFAFTRHVYVIVLSCCSIQLKQTETDLYALKWNSCTWLKKKVSNRTEILAILHP